MVGFAQCRGLAAVNLELGLASASWLRLGPVYDPFGGAAGCEREDGDVDAVLGQAARSGGGGGVRSGESGRRVGRNGKRGCCSINTLGLGLQ